jgi:hypothetical protein
LTAPTPNVFLGLKDNEVRISIACPNEAEALAVIQFIRDQLKAHGKVNIPIFGSADEVISAQRKAN